VVAKKSPPNKKIFKPEMAEVILEMGKNGASQKAMYSAIGISKDTAARLKKDDEFFAETMSMATTYGQAYWENMMLANVDNKAFNSRIAELALKGQYPDDYRDRMDVKQNIKQEVVIDYDAEISELIKKLNG
jgi:hypothetical protein